MMKISKRRYKNIKEWVKFALAIACVVVFAIFFVFNIWSPVKKPVSVIVPRGASVTGMTNYLYKNNIITSYIPHNTILFCFCQVYNENNV